MPYSEAFGQLTSMGIWESGLWADDIANRYRMLLVGDSQVFIREGGVSTYGRFSFSLNSSPTHRAFN